MRSVYALSLCFLGVSTYALVRGPVTPPPFEVYPYVDLSNSAGQWFQTVKPYCNMLEVEVIHRNVPPPDGMEGAGFSAACYALAGRIGPARARIAALRGDDRWKAAGIVFNIAHPIADAGDDRSAGPIMELVADFWPNHYQALYHAGASNYALGDEEAARRYLTEFLEHYSLDDGFTRNATSMLGQLGER